MPISTVYDAGTTGFSFDSDVLDDALRSLHISGSVLLREAYEPPWVIAVPDSKALAGLLDKGKSVLAVAFHLVEFGNCEIVTDGG